LIEFLFPHHAPPPLHAKRSFDDIGQYSREAFLVRWPLDVGGTLADSGSGWTAVDLGVSAPAPLDASRP
jgi:hypothetical protein